MTWVRFADRQPPPLQPVIVWTLTGTWFQATLYKGRFYQSNTNVGISNVTHWCEVTAPVD